MRLEKILFELTENLCQKPAQPGIIACLEMLRMRLYSMERTVPTHPDTPRESTRTWLSGLAVTLTAMVAMFAFWHLSPGITFLIGCFALLGLIVAAWHYGRETRLNRERVKARQRPTAPDV